MCGLDRREDHSTDTLQVPIDVKIESFIGLFILVLATILSFTRDLRNI